MLRTSSVLPFFVLPYLMSCGLIGNTGLDGAIRHLEDETGPENIQPLPMAEAGEALTGFAAGSDGDLIGVTLRLSEDGSTAWLSVNGEPAATLTGSGSPAAGEWSGGSTLLLIEETEGGTLFSLGDDYAGIVGELTDVASLPDRMPSYNGLWHSRSSDGEGRGNGSLRLELDFANGSVDGNISGGYHRRGSGGGSVRGTFEGSVDGAVIEGSTLIDGPRVAGTLTFMGGIYGEGGETAEGALGGALTTSAGTDAQSGGFLLRRTGR